MTHITIQEALNGKNVEWMDAARSCGTPLQRTFGTSVVSRMRA
jgi:hypothetical protein